MTRRVRRWLVGGVAVTAMLVVGRALWRGDVAAPDRAPLKPLADLVDGRWNARAASGEPAGSSEFRWGAEGCSLHEVERDDGGEVIGQTWYFWHPERTPNGGSLALVGVRRDGSVREGILREDEERSLELRWNAFHPAGGGGSYWERIRFLDDDRFVRSLHRKTEDEEILVEERTFER